VTGDCSNGTVTGYSDDDPRMEIYIRADCKKLSYSRCGPIKARRYREAIGRAAEANRLTRMMTLTLDPSKVGVSHSVSYLSDCFSKFRVYLQRKLGRSISFIAVVEAQQSGMAHLHCLISVYLDQRWISDAWQRVGGGRIVHIRFVDVDRINAYLAKYLTKELTLSSPPGKKRISTSRDIRLFEKRTARGWKWLGDYICECYRQAPARGVLQDIERDADGIVSFLLYLP
jgi:hypothetical protein